MRPDQQEVQMTHPRIRSILFCLLAAAIGGCESLTSPSDWVVGSSNAIAGSIQAISRSSGTGGAGAHAGYRRDVRAWAAEVARTGGSQDELLSGIGRIAESHGVTHWEAVPDTLTALGEGLADAGWTPAQMEHLRGELAGAQPHDVELVFEGYRQARS
jgi:hypothetical protein